MELGTHNAGIFSIAIDPSNRILVTGSEDKTARVWDISGSADLLRILRPPVGEEEQGHIFAVALSPDGRSVTCGGLTGKPKNGDACLYLFDRDTGSLTRRLGGMPGYVQHLVYTSDGRFLVAVMGERGGKVSWAGMSIFRLPDYALVAEDRDYGNYIRWVESSPSGSRLATSCFDGFVRLYDLSGLKAQDASSPGSIVPVSKIRPSGGQRPWGLAFSPDGKYLAVGFNLIPKVDVLEIKGNILDGLEWIQQQGTSKDVAVLFFTGHGINDPTGRQYALENKEWGNGAFTKAVVEGIGGKAAYESTGRITLNLCLQAG